MKPKERLRLEAVDFVWGTRMKSWKDYGGGPWRGARMN